MTTHRDPPRLRLSKTETPSVLRDALASARLDRPSDVQLDRLATRLGATLSVPVPTTAGTSATYWKGLLAKLGLSVLVGAAGVAGWMAWRGDAREAERVSPPAVVATSVAAATSITSPPVDRAPPAKGSADAPNPTAAAPSTPSIPFRPSKPAPASSSGTTPIDSPNELELLDAAHAALAVDPSLALKLAARHASDFPSGVLVEEREVIIIQALLSLRRHSDAARRADAFRRRFPSSAFLPRLDGLLEADDVSNNPAGPPP